MTEQDKVTVDDIIGIVKTEEPTNSVEEVRKLRGRENKTAKRFKVTDNTDNPFLCDWSVTDYADGGIVNHPMTSENMANVMCELLNELHEDYQDAITTLFKVKEENEQLKSSDTITDLETEIMNLKAILNDFINILNRLQSNPNNEQTLNVARDMLQNMGKELKK
jgi:hypothetical protein